MPPSTKENRKSRRKDVGYRAWLKCGDDPALLPCTLGDMSETGARLLVAEDVEIPDEFILQLTQTGSSYRKCRVAWRKGRKIGVAFFS